MRAAVLYGPRDLRVQATPTPEPGTGEVLVRVTLAGLCGTDHRIWSGKRAVHYPRVMGHELVGRLTETGERVVIDGPCLSACTLVLSIVPDDRICVTRRAVLGFHAARSIDRRGRMYAEPEASEAVLEAYPAPVRGWINSRGGLTSRLLLLRGRELAAIYPRCR